jgi:hypothetical protein
MEKQIMGNEYMERKPMKKNRVLSPRAVDFNRKTSDTPCIHYERGFCRNYNACKFKYGDEQMSQPAPSWISNPRPATGNKNMHEQDVEA